MENYSRYEKQFQGHVRVLERLAARYEPEGMQSDLMGRQGTILHLIRSLRQFADGQFSFFYQGFKREKDEYPWLYEESVKDGAVEYPAEHVLANTLAQISADITTIQLAAEQRRLVSLPTQQAALIVKGTSGINLLMAADRLAANALWPPTKKDAPDLGIKTVLTYLTDSVQMRVVPYAPVMLLGIPYSCLEDLRSFLAIPHEVGHFRYWYAFKQDAKNLETLERVEGEWQKQYDKRLNVRELFYMFDSQTPKPYWSEEIFADTYGALIGGPLSILTAMDLAVQHSTNAFQDVDLDDTHPAPLIRPALMLKAFLELNQPSDGNGPRTPKVEAERADEVAAQLLELWLEKLDARKALDANFSLNGIGIRARVDEIIRWGLPDDAVSERARAAVGTAVTTLRYAFRDLDKRFGGGWGWSSPQFGEWQDVKELYTNAEEMILKQFADSDDPTDVGPTVPDKLWETWVTEDKGYFGKFPPDVQELYAGEFNKVMDPRTRPSNTWLPVFGAGGWTTEGPCSVPPN